jgi:hypothetical protein
MHRQEAFHLGSVGEEHSVHADGNLAWMSMTHPVAATLSVTIHAVSRMDSPYSDFPNTHPHTRPLIRVGAPRTFL